MTPPSSSQTHASSTRSNLPVSRLPDSALPDSALPDSVELAEALNSWFARNARDLLWRHPDTSPYGVLVSEVMSQQTPVRRVEPLWLAWMERWPTPADLAAAPKAEVIRQWANLGYPRRAMRLQECAQACVDRHGGNIPSTVAELEALPGIGTYTARAVAAFAFGQAVPVVDTNVRRVYRRLVDGLFLQGPARARDLRDVAALLPFVDPDPALPSPASRRHQRASQAFSPKSRTYSPQGSGDGSGTTSVSDPEAPSLRDSANLMCAALMELGALVCTARSPRCEECPVSHMCRWVALGKPEPSETEQQQAKKRVQKFEGTDRQVRGRIMALLRNDGSKGPVASTVPEADIVNLWEDKVQLRRCVDSLLADGLIQATESEGMVAYHLPK